jgi:hypothetical protein
MRRISVQRGPFVADEISSTSSVVDPALNQAQQNIMTRASTLRCAIRWEKDARRGWRLPNGYRLTADGTIMAVKSLEHAPVGVIIVPSMLDGRALRGTIARVDSHPRGQDRTVIRRTECNTLTLSY